MSSKIKFTADRKSASEGEYVTLTWDCGMPDSVTLTIENGYRTSRLQLPDSGSRTILIEKSKGKTTFRLAAAQGTRKEVSELSVKVKNLKTIRAREYRPKSSKKFSLRGLWSRLVAWWRNLCGRVSYGWRVMPPRQKRIYKIVLIALAQMWAGSAWRNAGYRAGYEQALRDSQRYEMPAPQHPKDTPQPHSATNNSGTNSI